MPSCSIGFYPDLSVNPQVIQGLFYEVLNDPLYIKDMMRMIIPISDNSIFQKNKEHDTQADLLMADENSTVIEGKGSGYRKYNSQKDVYSGRGITPSGGKKRLSHMVEDIYQNTVPDRIQKDIRIGSQQVRRHIKQKKIRRKSRRIERPLVEDLFKMENRKKVYPASNLKKRLMSSKFKKRSQIKNLLERLR